MKHLLSAASLATFLAAGGWAAAQSAGGQTTPQAGEQRHSHSGDGDCSMMGNAGGGMQGMQGMQGMHGMGGGGMAGMCPMSNADVRMESTPNGAVLRLEAKDKSDVPQVQSMARMMAQCMSGQQQSTQQQQQTPQGTPRTQ